MNPRRIAPSILSADFAHLESELREVEEAGAQLLHLDIMDGHYVPNLTFGPFVVEAIRRMTPLPLEAHLMISAPDRYVQNFMDAGVDTILVHPSTTENLPSLLRKLKQAQLRGGIVFNPDESAEIPSDWLPDLDQVLFMSVFPGFGGQKFLPDVLNEIDRVAPGLQSEGVTIEIDGGVNLETIDTIREHAVDVFVAGSAVFRSDVGIRTSFHSLSSRLQSMDGGN